MPPRDVRMQRLVASRKIFFCVFNHVRVRQAQILPDVGLQKVHILMQQYLFNFECTVCERSQF
jgi:hypothetical protein